MISFTIQGELASKSNQRRMVMMKGVPRFIKSEKALVWEKLALLQIPTKVRKGYTGPIRLTAHIYYASRRPDLDVSLLQDTLERARVYQNDRQIVELHLYKKLDSHSPRVEVTIEELPITVRAA